MSNSTNVDGQRPRGGERRGPTLRRLAEDDLRDLPDTLQRNWAWVLALGAALVLGGTLAILMPFLASIAVEGAIGAVLLLAGTLQAVHVFGATDWGARAWAGLSAAVYLAGGVLLLLNPLAGLVAITLVIAAVFLVDGLLRAVIGVRMQPERGWGWMLTGGALSALLGVAIILMFPAISASLLGILVGISFIFEGWGFIFLGLSARKAARSADSGRAA